MPVNAQANLFLLILWQCVCAGDLQKTRGDDWNQWRGLGRNGVRQSAHVPLVWSEDENVQWSTPLPGMGISSPIVWKDQVIVAAAEKENPDQLHLLSFSLLDGDLQWHRHWWGTAPTRFHGSKSSMASPTPITDGEHIYSFYGTGDVFCVTMSGEMVWQRSLATEYGKFENRFSATSSPLLYGSLLILQCDHYGPSYALAIDKKTGQNVWKQDRPTTWLSWASPQLIQTETRDELILSGATRLDGLNPQTGERYWTVAGMRRECIPTPLIADGVIYAVSGPKGPTLAVRPGGRGDVTESHVLWSNPRGAPFVPSAVILGEYYYLVDDQGIATCLDRKDGQRVWQKRLPGGYTASPIATGQHVFFMNEDGETMVLEGHRSKFKQVSRNRLDAPIYASAALTESQLIIRTTQTLWCIGASLEPTGEAVPGG